MRRGRELPKLLLQQRLSQTGMRCSKRPRQRAYHMLLRSLLLCVRAPSGRNGQWMRRLRSGTPMVEHKPSRMRKGLLLFSALLVVIAGCGASDPPISYPCKHPDPDHVGPDGKPDPCHFEDPNSPAQAVKQF